MPNFRSARSPASLGLGVVLVLVGLLGYNWLAPLGLVAFNVSSSYGWSLARFGHRETHLFNQTGPWSGALSRLDWTGPIVALRGETVVIDYDVVHRHGRVSLSLDRGPLLPGEAVWSESITAERQARVTIEAPETGIYRVSMIFARFDGNAVVRWAVRP
jgi:hypothetical protein